ncbi:unnamed protein product, partial [Coregonus sp. 'balchen']
QVNRFGIPVSAHAGKFYGRDHFCGGLKYDVLDYTSCDKVLHKGAGLSCCGNRAFNLTQASCCEGRLTLNVSQLVSDCCGCRAYDPLNQLCCGSQILTRTQPHSKCCGKGPYNGASCGSQVYNPDINICCAGQLSNRVLGKNLIKYLSLHRHSRWGNKSCCGGKAYDPSSDQMKCCAGTLYNLQVQDRLSEEAQCCGTVLMEAGNNQTCCSAPGLDLLYPTQSGFTCCGHRYPNASLWSCCAGVLHPRSEPHTTNKNMIPGFGMTTSSTTEGKVLLVIYGLLGCSATILFFNLFLERVITMLGLCDGATGGEHTTKSG